MAGKVKVKFKAKMGDEVIVLVRGTVSPTSYGDDALCVIGQGGPDEIYVENVVGIISL